MLYTLHPQHPSEKEQKMRVPANEIQQFNAWATMQIVQLVNTPDEMTRLESVLYGVPLVARLTRADYVQAVEAARIAPDVPMSVYSAFKSYRAW
jgi:hypothetical protein